MLDNAQIAKEAMSQITQFIEKKLIIQIRYMAKKKSSVYNPYATSLRVGDLWPDVERIIVEYHAVHPSAFGLFENKDTATYTADRQAVVQLRCPTNDCTMGYLDISGDISSMVTHKVSSRSFEKQCPGREAEDHPEQACMTTYTYKISIEYCDG